MSQESEQQQLTAGVETRQQRAPMRSGGRVAAIVPQDATEVWRLAEAVCRAGMAPYGLDTPDKAAVAILHGLEVGLTPMMALRTIAVVGKRPTIWGDGALGLVRSSGLCEYVNEWVEGEGDARTAYCETKRKGEAKPVIRKFSVADAKTAKLWEKKTARGEDTPWVTNPDRMMGMRARGFCLRDVYTDVLGGLHLREEIEEDFDRQEALRPPAPPKPPAPPAAPKESPEPLAIEHRQPGPKPIITSGAAQLAAVSGETESPEADAVVWTDEAEERATPAPKAPPPPPRPAPKIEKKAA